MKFRPCPRLFFLPVIFLAASGAGYAAAATDAAPFPRPLAEYADAGARLMDTLSARVTAEPFNLVALVIFLLAIIHTFLTARFRHWAHEVEAAHERKLKERRWTDNN